MLAAHSRTAVDVGALRQALCTANASTLCAICAGQWPCGTDANWLPLHVAAWQNRHVDAVQLLLDSGEALQLQAQDSNGSIALHWASEQNSNVEVVRLLLDRGGAEQLAAQNKHGCIALHYAAQHNSNVEVVRLLLGRGCPRSSTDRRGASPLDLALRASTNRTEKLQLLIEAGAALDGVMRRLPPSLQATARSVSVSSVLLSYFADNVTALGAAVRP